MNCSQFVIKIKNSISLKKASITNGYSITLKAFNFTIYKETHWTHNTDITTNFLLALANKLNKFFGDCLDISTIRSFFSFAVCYSHFSYTFSCVFHVSISFPVANAQLFFFFHKIYKVFHPHDFLKVVGLMSQKNM